MYVLPVCCYLLEQFCNVRDTMVVPGVFVDITRSLTYYINNPQVAELIMGSFARIPQPGVIASYADGSAYKVDGLERQPQIDLSLYLDEADPLNCIGMLSFFLHFVFVFDCYIYWLAATFFFSFFQWV